MYFLLNIRPEHRARAPTAIDADARLLLHAERAEESRVAAAVQGDGGGGGRRPGTQFN